MRCAASSARGRSTPAFDTLFALVSDALALVDFNFSVLRDSGGDLQEYLLLIVSLRLYHALWPAEVVQETAEVRRNRADTES